MHYTWTVNTIGVSVDSPTVTIDWSDLVSVYGFVRGTSEQTYATGLVVSDDNGVSPADAALITLAANNVPIANIANTVNDEIHFAFSESVLLDGTTSSDTDTIDLGNLTYEWDIGDDGTIESTASSVTLDWAALSALVSAPGDTVTVALVVADPLSASDPVYVELVYDNTAPNPVASPGEAGYEIYAGQDLVLNASESSDVDQSSASLTYEWDLDNDTTFDDETGMNPTVPWASLAALGITPGAPRTIGLKVTDSFGWERTAQTSVTVLLPDVSIAFFDSDMNETKPGVTANGGIIRISRTGPNNVTTTGTISYPGGADRAAMPADFSLPSGWQNWTISNSDHVDIPVTIANDPTPEVEANEHIVVVLDAIAANYNRANETAEAPIKDNDRWDFADYNASAADSLVVEDVLHTWFDMSYMWSHIGAGKTSKSTIVATVSGEYYPFWSAPNRQVGLELELSFDINSESGVITMNTPNWSGGGSASGPLSCGFGWMPTFDTTNHRVTVTFDKLTVYAGGTVTMAASAAGGTVSLEQDYSWAHAETVAGIVVNLQGVIVED